MYYFRIILFIVLACLFQDGRAQTFAEWFSQKKTQKKYLQKQIEKLQVYLTAAKQGYTIASDGLNLVKDIKNGDFNLHKSYFDHLSDVSPAVSSFDEVQAAKDIYSYINRSCTGIRKILSSTENIPAGYIKQADKLITALLADVANQEQSLIDVITPGKLQMTDQERIDRIDQIYQTARKAKSLVIALYDNTRILYAHNIIELSGNQTMRNQF